MAADQAAAILILGTIGFFIWLVNNLPEQLNPMKPMGYLITSAMVLGGINIALAFDSADAARITSSLNHFFYGYLYFFEGFFFFVLIFYFRAGMFKFKEILDESRRYGGLGGAK